jgi:hypothetical protein
MQKNGEAKAQKEKFDGRSPAHTGPDERWLLGSLLGWNACGLAVGGMQELFGSATQGRGDHQGSGADAVGKERLAATKFKGFCKDWRKRTEYHFHALRHSTRRS